MWIKFQLISTQLIRTGFIRLASDPSRNKDCEFTWTDQTVFDYENWSGGEPNNVDGVENCVQANKNANFQWNDCPCNWHIAYVCEFRVLRVSPSLERGFAATRLSLSCHTC